MNQNLYFHPSNAFFVSFMYLHVFISSFLYCFCVLSSALSACINVWNTVFCQVCVYKDGQAIIDTAGGVLGKFDPRPVQPDSLFSCFSVTKGITAGLVHWLADQGYVLLLYSMLMAASDMIPYFSLC